MPRPAAKEREIARALGIEEAKVPARLAKLHAATESLRGLADYLTGRGVKVSKSWLQRALTSNEEDPS